MNANISSAASVTITRIMIYLARKNSIHHQTLFNIDDGSITRVINDEHRDYLHKLTSDIHEHEYLYCCLSNNHTNHKNDRISLGKIQSIVKPSSTSMMDLLLE